MTTRNRTTEQRVGDWVTAFAAVRDEVTPPPLREMITFLTKIDPSKPQIDPNTGEPKPIDPAAYASLVQASMGLARIVAANDRASGVIAAMLTQSGVTRPSLDVIESGETGQ